MILKLKMVWIFKVVKLIFSKIIEEDGQKKLVSIIIRGKNEAQWLKILFKELKKQTVKNFEIIFCDNNSEDETLEILKANKIKKLLNLKNIFQVKF